MSKLATTIGVSIEPQTATLTSLGDKTLITESDVVALRNADLALGLVSRQQAEQMFAIERGAARKCRAWSELLVESLLDYVVWGERPTGALTEAASTWLLKEIGPRPTPACLALLIAILEEATTVPVGIHDIVRARATQAFTTNPTLRAAA